MLLAVTNLIHMITVDKSHKLVDKEIQILQQIIGKKLICMMCSGIDLTTSIPCYNFQDTVNCKFEKYNDYVSIAATFDETHFGHDFISLTITNEKVPIGIQQHLQGGLCMPFASLFVSHEFVVRKIEVYGDSYIWHRNDYENEGFWKIEVDNPNQPITENVETENVLVFYSDNSRLMVQPYGALPWIRATFDEKLINQTISSSNSESNTFRKLKYTIN